MSSNEHHKIIVSLWDASFTIPRKQRNYLIPARPDNGKYVLEEGFIDSYATCDVFDAQENLEFGEKQKVPITFTAEKIAPDIVESDYLAKFGIFVARDEGGPTKAELQNAWTMLIKHLRWLIQDGDTKYQRPETRADVNDLHRKAVVMLGERREWVYQLVEKLVESSNLCPACGSEFKIADPAVCAVCGAVINSEKAAKYGLGGFTQVEAASARPAEQPRITGKFGRKE